MTFWEDTVGTMTAKCEYADGTFTVTVTNGDKTLTESFGQTFTPTFGMDVIDAQRSGEIAEKLAKELECQ